MIPTVATVARENVQYLNFLGETVIFVCWRFKFSMKLLEIGKVNQKLLGFRV